MPYRPERERDGFLKVSCRNGLAYVLQRSEYERLQSALEGGATWFEGTDLYGDPVLIRCEDVSGVMYISADSIAAGDQEDEDAAAYRRTHGEN